MLMIATYLYSVYSILNTPVICGPIVGNQQERKLRKCYFVILHRMG